MISVGDTMVTLGVGPTPGPGCSPTEVTLRVQAFLAAFNAGDAAALPTFFDRSLTFTESNPPPIGFFTSHGPQELADYFAARHGKHESRRIETIILHYGSQGTPDRIDFGYEIRRTADDLNGLAQGKGLMSCTSKTMSVWNMGDTR